MKGVIDILIIILPAVWITGIFIELLLPVFPSLIYLHPFLDLTYSIICHQQPLKTLEFNGASTLVCARCTGIYLGSFASALILIALRINKRISNIYFVIACSLFVLDIFFYSIGLYEYSKAIAFITGIFFGSVVFYYFYNGINEFFSNRLNKKEIK